MHYIDEKNTWKEKVKRTVTSALPVSKLRKGACDRSGYCCMLPNRCPFLRFDKDNKALCLVYRFRPSNCRKYPRVPEDQIAFPCGYYFEEKDEPAKTPSRVPATPK